MAARVAPSARTNPLTGDAGDGLCPYWLCVGCCLAACCVGIEYGIIYPTIYSYLTELEGSRPALMFGVASGCFSVCRSAMFVPLGALADRVGPRLPTALFFGVACLGNLYYFSATRQVDVVVARAVVGLGSAVTSVLMGVVGRCATDDPAQKAVRDRRLAVYNGTALLAILLGPGLAAGLAALPESCSGRDGDDAAIPCVTYGIRIDEYNGPGLLMAVLTAACAVWALACLPGSPDAVRGRSASIAVEAEPRTELQDASPMLLEPPESRAPSLLLSPTSGAVALDRGDAFFGRKRARHHAHAALVGRRGASTLLVSAVGGCMIATLDTAFPIVAKDDFGARPLVIALILAGYALMGVAAMVRAGRMARGPPEGAVGRKIRVVRLGLWAEVVGGAVGLAVFTTVPHEALTYCGLAAGAIVIFGAMFASNANIQLLAAVGDMKSHAGFYSGLRSVFVCAGRAVGGFMGGLLLDWDHSSQHVPVFVFILLVCSTGLATFACLPPRPAADELEEPLLSAASDCASSVSSRRPDGEQP